MGVCMCSKHGRSGTLSACAHIATRIDAGELGDFHRFEVGVHLLVCSDCLEAYGLARFSNHPGLAAENFFEMNDKVVDDFWSAFERIEPLRPYCANCVAAIEMKEAKRSGSS